MQRLLFVLQIMLSQSGIAADSQWRTVKPQMASLAAFTALKSDQDRQQLFEEYVNNLKVCLVLMQELEKHVRLQHAQNSAAVVVPQMQS